MVSRSTTRGSRDQRLPHGADGLRQDRERSMIDASLALILGGLVVSGFSPSVGVCGTFDGAR